MLEHPHEVAEVSKIGMAFTLINMKVFKNIKMPYFYIEHGDNEHYWGEDTNFCSDIKLLGQRIWCDNKLSKEIKHLDEFDYCL